MRIDQRKSGVVLSYFSQVIHILSGIIYTPIMLRLLGQSEYGLYQLVSSVVSYLSLLSLGFAASYMRFYSRAKAKNDENEVSKLNGMYLTIFIVMSVVCILCGFVMVNNIYALFDSGLTENEYGTAKVLMILMVFNLALTFPNSVFEAITSAHERFFFQKMLDVCQALLNPFLTLPLLLLGGGSVGMVCVTTFLTIAKLSVNVWFSLKKIKIKFILKNINFGLLKEMWIFTFYIFLNQIIDQVNWGVGKFLLGRMVGTVAVAIFGLGAQINTMYLLFSGSISNVFIPKVNRIVAVTDDNNELTNLFIKIGRLQFIVLTLILSGFVFLGKPFMVLWGGIEYADSYYVALLLIIPVTIPLIQNIGIEIQRAKNMHKVRSIVYFFMAIGNVIVSIPLIERFGVIGSAMGTCLSLICGNIIFMNLYYHKRIGLDMIRFWKEIIRFIPALIVPGIIGFCIMKFVNVDGIFEITVFAGIYTIVYCISMYLLGCNADEKKLVADVVNKIRKHAQ
ncbi:MAG: oligosaccharide flippase family protein [Clostridia bacterium]|nr:oligosaccharide flippase family protein [Clostridia bacterium]